MLFAMPFALFVTGLTLATTRNRKFAYRAGLAVFILLTLLINAAYFYIALKSPFTF